MGHDAEHCRKGKGNQPLRKVWKPRPPTVKTAVQNPQPQKRTETPRAQVVQPEIMVANCELTELKTTGAFFTWNNKHENGSKVYCKIDRVLIIAEWLNAFPECYANFLPEGLFDHCPCVILFREVGGRKGAPFKYFNMWSLLDDFHRVVEAQWQKRLKVALEGFQKQLRQDPLNKELCDAEAACAQELILLKKARTEYIMQKSKEKWMDEGDSNTAFFHASIKHKRMRNMVYQVKNKNGVLCTHQEDIQSAYEDYYGDLLGSSKTVEPISVDIAPVTDEEIKNALFSIPGTKAPGLDGYSSQFFKDTWTIIGKDFIAPVKSVFTSGKLLKACNATVLTMVPKVEVPEHITQFRPIACCNTIYKCVAKKRKESSYQPLCKRVQLSHLCFADDLVMFCRGDIPSVMLMLRAFKTFSLASGLIMNQGKSEIYCNGIDSQTLAMLVRVSGMHRGKIPFKYLGLNISPKRKFLWHGNEIKESLSLVAWDQICKAKKKGGLGLKHLYWWNIATMAKYVWWIAKKTDHLKETVNPGQTDENGDNSTEHLLSVWEC
ncbi:uncharacterized protein LOC141657277 [Silene latifolia]|uniref:uncharacterized protein LOC141657277 n=1 Tax=Silene latifolia TaxID=37657 RepID=UPI003D771E44